MTMSIIVMQDYNKSHRARVTSGPSTTPIVGRVMVKTVETHWNLRFRSPLKSWGMADEAH